ncbi:cytochrome b [Bremerella alba]|uniref:Cytochrome b561 n=1 Tax=Bremerella alba TaxID=980252 RepID=A0A7V8V709_9BACT|nr:cytochrome b/b6 domain-containing protein [Bremerella alba]MBA2116080.1 Cytochrome b561 [Bremerella alba]
MNNTTVRFATSSQWLHWIMAVLILLMLFVGVIMVTSMTNYYWLFGLHRSVGTLVLFLALLRLANRLWFPPPKLPSEMPRWERRVAALSEYSMYALMIVMPLVGWGMLSAARYPIVIFGSISLPFILPHDLKWYSVLHASHTVLAYVFFAMVLAHFGAVMLHTIVYRDGLLFRMLSLPVRGVGPLKAIDLKADSAILENDPSQKVNHV